jgi:hypothetical protein
VIVCGAGLAGRLSAGTLAGEPPRAERGSDCTREDPKCSSVQMSLLSFAIRKAGASRAALGLQNSWPMVRAQQLAHCGRHQYWPQWTALASLVLGLLALGTIAGCRNLPMTTAGQEHITAERTLTGNVRGPESIAAIEGRVVELVNVETNEHQRATTNNAGTFTFKVKPGKYRVVLALRDGESLLRSPGVMEVNRTDRDSHADFIVGARRISRPRAPAYRTNDGLGSPIG